MHSWRPYIQKIFLLSLPLLLAVLIQPIVGLIDMKMMGFKDNSLWLAALSIAVAIYTQLIWFFSFLFIGTLSSSAIAFGKNDNKEALHILYRNTTMALFFAFLLIALHPLFFHIAFKLINPSSELIAYGSQYLNIRIFFFFIPLVNYVASAWLLAQGKSIYILFYDIIFALFTILFNVIFVYIFHMNIKGIALGTICAELISFAALLFIYYRKTYVFKAFCFVDFKASLQRNKIFNTLQNNMHLFMRTLALIGILTLFNRYSNLFKNHEIIAANAVIFQLLMIMTTALGVFGEASASLVGKAAAKNDKKSLISIAISSFILSLGLGLVFMSMLYIFMPFILDFLTKIDAVKDVIYRYKIWLIILPLPMIIAFTFDGLFMGVHQLKSLRNASICAFFSFIIVFSLLPQNLYIHRLWIAFLCTFIVRSLYLAVRFHKIVQN